MTNLTPLTPFPWLLILGLGATATAVSAEPLTMQTLRNALLEQGASWQPAATSSFDPAAFERWTGLIPEVDDLPPLAADDGGAADSRLVGPRRLARRNPGAPVARPALPASLDWRNAEGASFMPPATTAQGSCGSCVAFAVLSTLEARLGIACNAPQEPFDLSRQFLFSCGGGSCRQGLRLSAAVDFLTRSGVPDTACMPYREEDAPCAEACEDVSSRLVEGIVAERPTSGIIDVDAIKQALLRGPVVSNMILYEDLAHYGGGVYRHVAGDQLGAHAVVLVGWSDADAAWIARNSWGDGWGEGGYFKVAWDDASLPGRYTWAFDVSAAVGAGKCATRR